jgi:hypothetical protein
MTNPTNTASTFNSTRLGLPIFYSSNYNHYFFRERQNTTGEGQIADVTTNNVVRNNNINSYNVDTQHILDFNNTTQNILSVNNKKDGKFYNSKSYYDHTNDRNLYHVHHLVLVLVTLCDLNDLFLTVL